MFLALVSSILLSVSSGDQDWVAQFVKTVRDHSYKPVPEKLLRSGDTQRILAYLDPFCRVVTPRKSELDFIRGFVREDSLEGPLLFRPGIAYIKIRFFGRRTAGEFREAMKRISRRPLKGIVVDVRSNRGGFLLSARELIETWIPAGETYLTVEHRGPRISAWVSSNRSPLLLPTVVLVNDRTASCPEVFAASLQAAKKAKVAGTGTYGKRFIQEAFPLDPRHVLFLTTAKYRTGNAGRDFSGVVPDVRVADESAQFMTALKLLRNQGKGL